MVERWPEEQGVAGSTPARPTNEKGLYGDFLDSTDIDEYNIKVFRK